MSLMTLLDDSDLTKIRKSIFIFAAIGFVAWYYQIEITSPKGVVSAFANTNDETAFKLTCEHILTLVFIVETYLLARLWLAWRVSHAVFTRQWLIDVDENVYSFDKIRKELERFNTFSEGSKEPIENLLSEFAILCEDQEQLLLVNRNNLELIRDNHQVHIGIPEKLKHDLNELRKAIKNLAFPRLSSAEKDDLLLNHPELERIEVNAEEPIYLGVMSKLLDRFYSSGEETTKELTALYLENKDSIGALKREMDEVKQYKKQIEKYLDLFKQYNEVLPDTLFHEILSSKSDEFRKARDARKIERFIFELLFPGLISVVVAAASLIVVLRG